MENWERISSRPRSVWRCSAVWSPATMVEAVVEGSRDVGSSASVSAVADRRTLCSSFFFFLPLFNQSAMAYMVCRGPKIRRRKLNNVFLFFKGRCHGWLIIEQLWQTRGNYGFCPIHHTKKGKFKKSLGWLFFFKQMLADLLLNIPS